MQSVIDPIRHNLRSLTRFSGRDSRAQFWPYAVFVYLFMAVVSTIAALPMFMSTFARMERYARANPDKAQVSYGPGRYSVHVNDGSVDLMPDLSGFMIIVLACSAVMIALVAAAIVRRLHDTGRSGAWALLPLPFLLIGFVGFAQIFGDLEGLARNPGMFVLLFLNNMIYLATLGVLVVMLVLRGTPGPNRFGEPPAP